MLPVRGVGLPFLREMLNQGHQLLRRPYDQQHQDDRRDDPLHVCLISRIATTTPYRTEVVNGHTFEWLSSLFHSSKSDFMRGEHRLDGNQVPAGRD